MDPSTAKPFTVDADLIEGLRQQHPDAYEVMVALRDNLREMKPAANKASVEFDGWERFDQEEYWPIKTSAMERSGHGTEKALAQWAMSLPENLPFTKERTGHSNVIQLRDDFSTYFEHVHGLASYIAMTPHIRKLMAILDSAPVKTAAIQKFGKSFVGESVTANSFWRRQA